jgi:predicted MFS family arabinose efflux permease
MVSAVAVQAAAMTPAFLTGALAVQLRDELDFSNAGLGGAVAFFFLLAAAGSPHAGTIADRLGARRSLRIAATLSAASLLGCSQVRGYPALLAMVAIGAVGLALAGPGTKIMVARGVPLSRHGLAFGVQAGAVPLSSFLAGVMVPAVAIPLGWQWAYVTMAGVAVLGFVLAPPIGPDGAGGRRTPAHRLSDIGYRPLVMLGLAAALGSAAATTLAAFFVSAATDTGIDEGVAGAMLAVGSATVVAARIYAGVNADRRGTDPLRTVSVLMAVSTAGYLLTATDSKVLLPIGALFALGAGWSWSGLIVHAVVRRYHATPGAATGVISSGLSVGGVVGPLAFGLVVDRFSYSVGFLVTALSALAASAAVTVGRRRLDASVGSAAEPVIRPVPAPDLG